MNQQLLALLWGQPIVAGAAGALILMLLKMAFGMALNAYSPAKQAAQAVANINDFILEKVKQAEATGALKSWTGEAKAEFVMNEIDQFLKEQGIVGDPKAVTLSWARAQVELIRAQVFPSTPAK